MDELVQEVIEEMRKEEKADDEIEVATGAMLKLAEKVRRNFEMYSRLVTEHNFFRG